MADASRRLEPDEPLPALAEMVGALFEDIVALDADGEGARVESLRVELPVEVDIALAEGGEGGVAAVRVSPPTSYTETSVMPVLHRLLLRLERDGG
jgi:hypothetical protein